MFNGCCVSTNTNKLTQSVCTAAVKKTHTNVNLHPYRDRNFVSCSSASGCYQILRISGPKRKLSVFSLKQAEEYVESAKTSLAILWATKCKKTLSY